MGVAEGKRKASNLIEYVIVSRSGTKVVRISEAGVKKLIRKEIKSGVPVADLIEQKLKRGWDHGSDPIPPGKRAGGQ